MGGNRDILLTRIRSKADSVDQTTEGNCIHSFACSWAVELCYQIDFPLHTFHEKSSVDI